MLRHILWWAACIMACLPLHAQTISPEARCGFDPFILAAAEHDESRHLTMEPLLVPSTFSSSAIQTCGKFKVYYEDVNLGTADGFDDPVVGGTRQNTLCAALEYVQSVFDFSGVPTNEYIRLQVKRSYTHANPARGSLEGICGAGPYWNTAATAGDTVNGFVWDYVHDGSDPSVGNYHAYIRMDFDSITALQEITYIDGHDTAWFQPVITNDGLDTPTNCTFDLYSIMLHSVGHCMGWFSWFKDYHTPSAMPFVTNIDTSLHQSPDTKTLSSTLTLTSYLASPTSSDFFWLNGKQPPENHPVSKYGLSHLVDEINFIFDEDSSPRISPGDNQEYVMGTELYKGLMRRLFAKGEIEAFHDIIGYSYNPAYASANAAKIANHTSWSSKLSFTYSPYFDSNIFSEIIAADYTVTNNTGSSVVINLNTDVTLHDADGDSLFIYPGSLVNLRGCGDGGNNHTALSVDASGSIITYTPRHNFFGRAQLMLNIWDKKEKGAVVIYTIDVAKGNNVSVAAGTNLVLNGDFEEGSEVKLLNTAEFVNNSKAMIAHAVSGRFMLGHHFQDCHSFTNNTAIQYSYAECWQTNKRRVAFGDVFSSFPWAWGHMNKWGTGSKLFYPDSSTLTKNRYETHYGSSMYVLGDTLKKCRQYLLEFDVRHVYNTGYSYGVSDTIVLGFADRDHRVAPDSTFLTRRMLGTTTLIDTAKWTHMKIPVTYCSDTPATAFYLSLYGRKTTIIWGAPYLIDNMSLKEVPLKPDISDSSTVSNPCTHYLRAGEDLSFACGGSLQYTWRKLDGTFAGTGPAITISALETTTYIVTVNNGCDSAKDSITVTRCACSPGALFGAGNYATMSGNVTLTSASGNFYVPGDVVIANTASFTNSVMLMGPGVTITVPDSVKLTLDACHLLTCPDTNKLWKGIVLNSGPSLSGRIEVINNSLIEDAETAIKASTPKIPGSGDIIKTDQSIFNRNQTAISVDSMIFTSPSIYPLHFRGTVFTSRKMLNYPGYPLSWPQSDIKEFFDTNSHVPPVVIDKTYPMASLKDGSIPFVGLRLTNVGYTNPTTFAYTQVLIGDSSSSTDRNLFDNTGDGVYASASNLLLMNNAFIRMPRNTLIGTGPLPAPFGSGIYATSNTSVKSRLDLPYTAGVNNSRNWFYDCYVGIKMTNYWEMTAQGCIIQSSNNYAAPSISSGFNLSSSLYSTINIDGNVFYNIPTGIYMFTVTTGLYTPGQVNIVNNKMNANNPALVPSSLNYIKQGISVGASVTSFTGYSTYTMLLQNNNLQHVYNGILVNGIKRQQILIDTNLVTLDAEASAASQMGINVTNCFNSVTTRNVCSTDSRGGATSDKVRAYYFASNTNTLIRCNDAYSTGRGYEFFGVAQPLTRWTSNTMEGHLKGFVLSSIIGDQGNSGTPSWNKWNGTWSVPNLQTYATSSSVNSKIYVRNLSDQHPAINQGLFPTYTYKNDTSIFNTGVLINPDDPCVPLPPFMYPPKKPPFGIAPSLYRIIANDIEYGDHEAISSWIAQYSLYQAFKSDSVINDTVYSDLSSFPTTAVDTRFGWLTNVESALAEDDISTAGDLLSSPLSAAGRIEVNADVIVTDTVDADYIVDHYTAFYNVYLDVLQGNPVDSEALATIAFLCPKTDGDVVYQARALYAYLYDYKDGYDDENLCGISTSRVTTAALQEQGYSLYPNPNNGNLSIMQYVSSKSPVRIQVYNIQGIMIYQGEAIFNGNVVSLHLGDIASGLYLLHISESSGRNFTMKFIVQ